MRICRKYDNDYHDKKKAHGNDHELWYERIIEC